MERLKYSVHGSGVDHGWDRAGDGGWADEREFAANVCGPATVTGVAPTTGVGGTAVTISGTGFGSSQGSGVVWLGSTRANVVSWRDTQISATVAANAIVEIARHWTFSRRRKAVINPCDGGWSMRSI